MKGDLLLIHHSLLLSLSLSFYDFQSSYTQPPPVLTECTDDDDTCNGNREREREREKKKKKKRDTNRGALMKRVHVLRERRSEKEIERENCFHSLPLSLLDTSVKRFKA